MTALLIANLAPLMFCFFAPAVTMRLLAENSWRAAFCTPAERDRALRDLVPRPTRARPQPSVSS